MTKTFLLSTFCLLTLLAQSQDGIKPKLNFGIEIGTNAYSTNPKDYDFIRATSSSRSYSDERPNSGYSYYAGEFFFAFKTDLEVISNKLWLASGIGYSNMNSELISNSSNGLFFVQLQQENKPITYYKVTGVSEYNQYILIPAEVRLSVFEYSESIKFYLYSGIDVNIMVSSAQEVSFKNPDMAQYEGAVLDNFEQPKNVYIGGALGGGFQLGKPNKSYLRLEAELPAGSLSHNAFGLLHHKAGGGIKISYVLPLKKN